MANHISAAKRKQINENRYELLAPLVAVDLLLQKGSSNIIKAYYDQIGKFWDIYLKNDEKGRFNYITLEWLCKSLNCAFDEMEQIKKQYNEVVVMAKDALAAGEGDIHIYVKAFADCLEEIITYR